MRAKVQKWGNSLAIRLPKTLADRMHLGCDSQVRLDVEDGRLVVTPEQRRPTLDELLAGVTKDNIHGETDLGPPVGREIW